MYYHRSLLVVLSLMTHFIVFSTTKEKTKVEKVKLGVYYTSTCPNTREFFTTQLKPTYDKLSDHVKLDLVPYGFTLRFLKRGRWMFICQDGIKECDNNRILACAGKYLKGKKLVDYLACNFEDEYFSFNARRCAAMQDIEFKEIKMCVKREEASRLLEGFGNQTDKLVPPIDWVPTVTFNGKYTMEEQGEVLEDLMSVICNHFAEPKPSQCISHEPPTPSFSISNEPTEDSIIMAAA